MKVNQNIFITFLQLLGVKHTEDFSNKYYNEHPNKYNLLGLSQMLSDYKIENTGVRIQDVDNGLFQLEVPFIAHVGGDFVVVSNNSTEKIIYYWKGKKIEATIEQFNKVWSGVILVAEPSEQSIEPKYHVNQKKELINDCKYWLLFVFIFLFFVLGYIDNGHWKNYGISLAFIFNFIGIYICYLLVLKQINIQSVYADKICSLFKQNDCNNILETNASKLFGFVSWSEIGLGFFLSNMLIITFFPIYINYSIILNICALPYTVWSVWHQGKTRQWCPLCLIIQLIIWLLFIANYISGVMYIPRFTLKEVLSVGCLYFIPFITINILLPLISKGKMEEQITQEINSLKATNEIFLTLLMKQPYSKTDKSISKILLGNPCSEILITILTNPHCEPCAKLHARVENFLEETNDKFCIQYVFSSFSEKIGSSSEFLIQTYLSNDLETTMKIYHNWFVSEKYEREAIFEKYHFDKNNTSPEYDKHKQWVRQSGFLTTPTILVNGYKLPENYKIEDLKFITKFNVII
jgi:ABC-type bacteriocin/lantibiotic exporters, contain an N-terminal double-glycine peptidase domain